MDFKLFLGRYQSSGTGLLPIFLEILLMMEKSSSIFCSPLFFQKEMETTDLDILFSSSLADWTTAVKEVPQTPAVQICPKEEVPGGQ